MRVPGGCSSVRPVVSGVLQDTVLDLSSVWSLMSSALRIIPGSTTVLVKKFIGVLGSMKITTSIYLSSRLLSYVIKDLGICKVIRKALICYYTPHL